MSPLPAPEPAEPSAVIERVDAALARGDGMFALRDTHIALVMGTLHGLRLEGQTDAARETAVSAARAGYALAVAVGEDPDRAATPRAPLRTLIQTLERERPTLMHWDAMQIAAWEAMEPSDELESLGLINRTEVHDDAQRTALFVELATAARDACSDLLSPLPLGDAVHAVRFGYGLRIAEESLPEDPARLLGDVRPGTT